MIVVKIELWPYGDEDLSKHLGTVQIINARKGLIGSDYDVFFMDHTGERERYLYDTTLKHVVREKGGFWKLIGKAFQFFMQDAAINNSDGVQSENNILERLDDNKKGRPD